MRAILARLIVFLMLLNISSADDLFAKAADTITKSGAASSGALTHTSEPQDREADCDDETCSQHQCHLGHCQFYVSRMTVAAVVLLQGKDLSFPPRTDAATDGYLSSLIKPPSAC
jgi:hypothetical protein